MAHQNMDDMPVHFSKYFPIFDSLSFTLKIGILEEKVMFAMYQCPDLRLFATSYFSVINSMAFSCSKMVGFTCSHYLYTEAAL